MATYWYSTNGMDQRRLSNRHLAVLDQAFERRTRVQIFDDDAFGRNVPAIANPYQGTMTAGDIHFGLYRHPSLWQMSEDSLDTLILMDSELGILSGAESTSRSRYPSNIAGDAQACAGNQRDHMRTNVHSRSSDSNVDAQDEAFSRYRFASRKRQSISPAENPCCQCCIIT
ncbi:hypothetical protein EC973_009553 [Apophysomyces ossiformis]|uniref:Uncharacterized protein n=1 Tax=Apophysomyces ossiformis TaxID=679940 RepID=A0A8H7ESW0_9FUNG|nr:hypothetical protein EC973_009553 [Apophysomyces ossiformis]